MKKIMEKLGFDKKRLIQFLLVASNSQLIYAFYALRSVMYDPFVETLGVTNTQFGFLMSVIGVCGTFGSFALGWLQDLFSVRKILTINSFITAGLGLIVALTPVSLPYIVLLAIWFGFGLTTETFYWASALKGVRAIAKEDKQATAFGIFETVRGGWEFIVNSIGSIILAVLGGGVFGVRAAMTFACVLLILSGLSVWFFVPDQKPQFEGNRTRGAFKGLLTAIKLPAVWLTGLGVCCVYATFAAVNTYFVPYLTRVYAMPVTLVAVFGLVNGSVTRFTAAPLSGIIADLKFKTSAHMMRVSFCALVVLLTVALLLPKTPSMVVVAMVVLLLIAICCFLVRGIYYSPIGEMGVPTEMSAAAMSVAVFIGQSPQFWAYPLYGHFLDTYEPVKAYSLIFTILICLAVVGIVVTTLIGRKVLQIRAARAASES